jgi:hypothetical protein
MPRLTSVVGGVIILEENTISLGRILKRHKTWATPFPLNFSMIFAGRLVEISKDLLLKE